LLFGYPGGAALPLYRELANWRGELAHVLVRHEQNAAHAADGYARASGKVGACVVTSGPGATNLVTGLATAWMDGVPLLALTAQVATTVQGTMAFQEVDIVSVARPVTKGTFAVRSAAEIPSVVAQALQLAKSGRPGPVLIDLPRDVLAGAVALIDDTVAEPADLNPNVAPELPSAAARVAALLNRAQRPVLLAGQGVVRAGAVGTLRAIAERADVPVGTTLLGLGAFPEGHRLALGMVGMHGTVQANVALHEADLVIGLGARFDDRVVGRARDFAPGATIVHVDVDPAAFGRVVRCDVPVLADVAAFLAHLAPAVETAARPSWLAHLRDIGDEHRMCMFGVAGQMTSPSVIQALRLASGDEVTVVADVGQHQMFAALHWGHDRPGRFFTTGGLGTMGYAVPAAMGVQRARPGEVVWAIVGDGGFQMSAPELTTLAAEGLPVKIAILNNGYLGMVRQWQEKFYDGVYSHSALAQPDFARLAEAHGCYGRRVTTLDEVPKAIAAALNAAGPAVLDFRVDPEETVFPMVPPGASVGEVVCAEGRVL
jgi:acetolactate synthase-1/2/3 large subunit